MKFNLLITTVGIVALGVSAARANVSTQTQDLNSDGVVTFQEFIDSHADGIKRTQAFIDRHRSIFDAADTNGDEVVDHSESQGGSKAKDANKP